MLPVSLKHISTLYVDFDHCLIQKGAPNVELVSLLERCREQEIRLVLLTRHEATCGKSVYKTMHTLGIPALLFHDIIELDLTTPKSLYIEDTNSVFIDDSPEERSDVAGAAGIPVFHPSQIRELTESASSDITNQDTC